MLVTVDIVKDSHFICCLHSAQFWKNKLESCLKLDHVHLKASAVECRLTLNLYYNLYLTLNLYLYTPSTPWLIHFINISVDTQPSINQLLIYCSVDGVLTKYRLGCESSIDLALIDTSPKMSLVHMIPEAFVYGMQCIVVCLWHHGFMTNLKYQPLFWGKCFFL